MYNYFSTTYYCCKILLLYNNNYNTTTNTDLHKRIITKHQVQRTNAAVDDNRYKTCGRVRVLVC